MTLPSTTSATQVESYRACPRAWLFRSVLRLPQEAKGFLSLGTAYHSILEHWPFCPPKPESLDDEQWDLVKALAAITGPLLPTAPALREHHFSIPTYPQGPIFRGFIDYLLPPGTGIPALLIPDTDAVVLDHKTLSDFKYMKTPQELAQSVQMMSYAHYTAHHLGAAPLFTRLVQVYARTKLPVSRASVRDAQATVTPTDVSDAWGGILDTVREMQHVGCQAPSTIPAKGIRNGHCHAYGGCSYRAECNALGGGPSIFFDPARLDTPRDNLGEVPLSSFLDKLRAAKAAQAATPAPTPAPVAAPKGPISALLARCSNGQPALGGELARAYAIEQGHEPADGYAGTGSLADRTCHTLPELTQVCLSDMLPTGVIPPEAPSREQPIITRPGDPVPSVGVPVADDEDDTAFVQAAVDTGTPLAPSNYTVSDTIRIDGPPVASNQILLDPPPRKRGRPSKAEVAARATAPSPSGTLTLYIDCVPTVDRSNPSLPPDWSDWGRVVLQDLAQRNGVADWRLIPYTARGELSAALTKHVADHGVPARLTVSSQSSGAEVAIDILTALASVVVKGLR